MKKWPSEVAVQSLSEDGHVFSTEDYMSGDGMQTSIFGPVFWTTIHLVSFNYPVHPTPEQQRHHKEWLLATGNVLPCRYCRDNFADNVKSSLDGRSLESVFESRDSFSRFCHRLHSEVNRMLNKESRSFEDIRSVYEGFRSRCLTKEQEATMLRMRREAGCEVEKHSGTKGKCVLQIVPRETVCDGLTVDDECQVRRI